MSDHGSFRCGDGFWSEISIFDWSFSIKAAMRQMCFWAPFSVPRASKTDPPGRSGPRNPIPRPRASWPPRCLEIGPPAHALRNLCDRRHVVQACSVKPVSGPHFRSCSAKPVRSKRRGAGMLGETCQRVTLLLMLRETCAIEEAWCGHAR